MESQTWTVDDSAIPDSDHVYRRFNIKTDTLPDLLTGKKTLQCKAFRYDHDGMSVSVASAMATQKIEPEELVDWSERGIVKIPVEVVRRQFPGLPFETKDPPAGTVASGKILESPGGVLMNEVKTEGDPRIGKSHGLVRIDSRPPASTEWKAFRNKLMLAAEIKFESGAIWRLAF